MELVPAGKNRYCLPRQGKMQVDAVIFVNERLREQIERDAALKQLSDAATLPGVVQAVYGMPDLHEGFGLPIGGVMATDVQKGIISAGAVGMDINCGVRLLRTNLTAGDLNPFVLRELIRAVENYVPTGVGKKSRHLAFGKEVFRRVTLSGAKALVEQGWGWPEDLPAVEEEGCLLGATLEAVSKKAIERGEEQLGTLGGGNHFIEIQKVTATYHPFAQTIGLFKDQITVMIHTGSRGFGHQICTDYTKKLVQAAKNYQIELPSTGLACAPINSPEGRAYYAAMASAVNYAFGNRQMIAHDIRRAFSEVFQKEAHELGMETVYDVAHNIAKFEEHGKRKVLVHRKGATRALPAGHLQNPLRYQQTGHPVLVPGSMGTASYVLLGTPAAQETFFSVNHGAGRILSRTAAEKTFQPEEIAKSMAGILCNLQNYRYLLDEAPFAYKNIEDVVETLVEVGFVLKVARLEPLAVIKGKD